MSHRLFVDGKAHTIRVPLLAGPYSRSFEIDPSQSTSVIGVNFLPGAARLFFPVAASELHNTDISLSALDPAEADRLRAFAGVTPLSRMGA